MKRKTRQNRSRQIARSLRTRTRYLIVQAFTIAIEQLETTTPTASAPAVATMRTVQNLAHIEDMKQLRDYVIAVLMEVR